jgi:hypothetical protein
MTAATGRKARHDQTLSLALGQWLAATRSWLRARWKDRMLAQGRPVRQVTFRNSGTKARPDAQGAR